MNTVLKSITITAFFFAAMFHMNEAVAQRISATANISSFNINKSDSDVADINYSGSTSASVNLRYYTKNKWAFRVGAGIDDLKYDVGGGISTDYQGRRQDIKAVIGLEKHFKVAMLDVYPGVYVPITKVGDDDIATANLPTIRNNNYHAGLGVLLGANIKMLKIMRVGVEVDATYNNFKTAVWESAESLSFAPMKGINLNTALTVGVAF